MYAIVEIAGQQFKVSKDLKVYVNRLSDDEGAAISFAKVLLLDDNGMIHFRRPGCRRSFSRSPSVTTLKRRQSNRFQEEKKKRLQKEKRPQAVSHPNPDFRNYFTWCSAEEKGSS